MLIGLSGCGGIFTDEVLTEVGNGSPVIILQILISILNFRYFEKRKKIMQNFFF